MSVPNSPLFERALRQQAHSEPIELVQTHISIVGLTAHQAFKMKKPVRFGFVDFSTVAKRSAACDEEIKLNRRYSQHVYLEKLPLRRAANGTCKFSKQAQDGEIVDWVIKMRRLPEELTLQQLILGGNWTPVHEQRLFHLLDLIVTRNSPLLLTPEAYQRELITHVADNRRELHQLVADRDRDTVNSIHESLHRFIELQSRLWQQRVCDGRVVHGHGDLRPCHIYLTPTPAVIDCVEFSQDLRTLDLLDEVCFLLMELDRLKAAELASRVLAWYGNSGGDGASDSLAAFYKCYRAVVRWKVELLQAASQGQEYRDLAEQYRERLDPRRLVVIGGLSGSGKTVLATALAERLKCLDLHTDVVRREAEELGHALPVGLGLGYGHGKYSKDQRAENYQRMLNQAAEAFSLHRCIILDGTFGRQIDREAAERLATRCEAQFLPIWCVCPEHVRKNRIAERLATLWDASEIHPDQLLRQAEEAEVPSAGYLEIDTTASLPDQLELVCHRLSQEDTRAAELRQGPAVTRSPSSSGSGPNGGELPEVFVPASVRQR